LCPVNATDFTRPFGPPVLQVSSEHLAAIEQAVTSGGQVRLVAHSTRTAATAFNVVAEAHGTRPELKPVCVMTPRSGWYLNASERGGGLASWLEAIRAVAATKPRRTVRFVASSGHELGHRGLHSYLDRNPALASGALAWVHLGANIGASTGPTAMTCSDDRVEAAALRALGVYGIDDLPRTPAAQVGGEALTISRKAGGSSRSSAATRGSQPARHLAGCRGPAGGCAIRPGRRPDAGACRYGRRLTSDI
jgi:hypothetical protein